MSLTIRRILLPIGDLHPVPRAPHAGRTYREPSILVAVDPFHAHAKRSAITPSGRESRP